MLRSRATISIGSISTKRSSHGHCSFYSSSSNSKWPKNGNKATEEVLLIKPLFQTSDSALIRTWTFPTSMRDAFAIIRAVERKYGLVKEFKYFRDFEVPSSYQGIIKVAFRDPDSQKRIPEETEELRIVLPPAVLDDQPGGIGLADLEEYLSPTESPLNLPSKSDTVSTLKLDNVMANVINEAQANVESENAERVITCRIQRTNTPFYTPSYKAYYWPSRQEREAIARQFLNWGGFHEFPPIENRTLLPDADFFGSPKIDHFRMRRCLRRASKFLEVPNPYEYSPEHAPNSTVHTEEVLEEDWEPLSCSSVSQTDHDTLSFALEEIHEMERTDDVLPIVSEDPEKLAQVEQQEIHDNASSMIAAAPHSSNISLNPEQPLGNVAPESTTPSNELAEQLRAARVLVQQVAEEQRGLTKPKHTSSSDVLENEANMQAEGSSLEDGVSGQNVTDVHSLRPEMTGEQTESRQEESKSMGDKLKYTWRGLF